MIRKVIGIVVLAAAVGAVVVLGTGAGGDSSNGGYKLRAIFRNAFSVIPGEDVKIAGVKVGKIESLDVTPDQKAAVVLAITEPGFQDFRKDGTCTIRPQSLIGEKFVECTLTQPRAQGDPAAPKLDQIKSGDGKGQYLLPVAQTRDPVDIDLLNNIMRLPYRERFSVIVNELGTGLAANGGDLRQAVRAADPALMETDKVLAILAQQNKVLSDLAVNGDKVLAPLARDKAKVADFIQQANTTAQASAQRRTDIERNIQKFPAFLQQLKPTMTRLGALADQMTPVLQDLGSAAPDINRFIQQLGPFSQAGIPAFQSLGAAADVGDQALIKSRPLIGTLRTFAGNAKPLTKNLSDLLTSFQQTGGIERLMDYIFLQASAINGFDTIGHYLRAVLVVNTCTSYNANQPDPACTANFKKATAASASSAQAKPTVASVDRAIAAGADPMLARTNAVAHGLDPKLFTKAAIQQRAAAKRKKGNVHRKAVKKISLPASMLPGSAPTPTTAANPATDASGASGNASGGTTSTTTTPSPNGGGSGGGQGSSGASQTLLDYLLGG